MVMDACGGTFHVGQGPPHITSRNPRGGSIVDIVVNHNPTHDQKVSKDNDSSSQRGSRFSFIHYL